VWAGSLAVAAGGVAAVVVGCLLGWFSGVERIVVELRDRGGALAEHPWAALGLFAAPPLLVAGVALLLIAARAAVLGGDPRDNLRQAAAVVGLSEADRPRAGRYAHDPALLDQVPGWVVTGDLRRLRLVGALLVAAAPVCGPVALVAGVLPGVAVALLLVGAPLLVLALRRIRRRRQEAARLLGAGPDEQDVLESIRERSRPARGRRRLAAAVLTGIAGAAYLVSTVDAWRRGAASAEIVLCAVAGVTLGTAALLLQAPGSIDDLGWRASLCTATRRPLPHGAVSAPGNPVDREPGDTP